jgi:hypothetical protein
MFWTLPRYMLKSLLYLVLSDSLISVIVWYWLILYSEPWGKFDESMKLDILSYDILRYVYLPARVLTKINNL